jgi:hypothetical protein
MSLIWSAVDVLMRIAWTKERATPYLSTKTNLAG